MNAARLRTIGRYLVEQAGLTLVAAIATRTGAYFVGAETHVPWLWPVTGVGLAALTLLGIRAWPALLLGGVLGRGGAGDTAWTLAAVDTAQAVAGALVLRAWPSFRVDLSRLRRRVRAGRRHRGDRDRRRARRDARHARHRRCRRGRRSGAG